MTNREIKNKFVRKLVALELWGNHESRNRSGSAGHPVDPLVYRARQVSSRRMAFRFQIWLDRNPDAIVAGDPAPLAGYRFFAGH